MEFLFANGKQAIDTNFQPLPLLINNHLTHEVNAIHYINSYHITATSTTHKNHQTTLPTLQPQVQPCYNNHNPENPSQDSNGYSPILVPPLTFKLLLELQNLPFTLFQISHGLQKLNLIKSSYSLKSTIFIPLKISTTPYCLQN